MITFDKHMSYAEMIASLMLIGTGLMTMERGLFWIIETDTSLFDSHLYATLSLVMPLWIWGLIFALSGLFVILASLKLPKRDTAISFAIFLLIGGLGSSVAYFIITIAGFGNAETWLTPVQYITLSGLNGILAFIGGVRIWQTKITS